MTAKEPLSLQNHDTVIDFTGKVPVEHLDYGYVDQCKDVKYLEKILKVLRSGEEGIYPDLISFCENRLALLDPKNRLLRTEKPVATAASLCKDEWGHIVHDLKMWQEESKKTDNSLKHSPLNDIMQENIPPIRGSNQSVPLNKGIQQKQNKNLSKRPLPRDYREWEKFDVEKECEMIDSNSNSTGDAPAAAVDTGLSKLKTNLDASLLTEQEQLILATREKDKGNEAFKAKDYEEAIAYYSRSLSILPTVTAHNNRAQAEIKLKCWNNAMKDCEGVLKMEPGNIKALLRRATVYTNTERFELAAEDLRTVLKQEPQNPAALKLLSATEMKLQEGMTEKKHKGKKILIQEVDGDESDAGLACPVDRPQAEGGEVSPAAPAQNPDMGNAQKRPHGRRDSSPHSDNGSSHHHHSPWRGKASSGEKYKVSHESKEKAANGADKTGSNASADQSGKSPAVGQAKETVNLDAPCGALPPPLSRLKNEGNLLFKAGQFADALEKYSQVIQGCTDSGIDSPEDLCLLYSNRAACYLKDGNCQDCIQDCTKALELQPFSLKPLLRRAMAYDSLERYPKAYVDYKTVLQIDTSVQAAHDSVNRITRMLIEQDGPDWREKLPDIPLVPLSAQQHRRAEQPSEEALQARAEKAKRDAERRADVQFSALKQEGNDCVKKGQYSNAVGKYTDCLKLKPEECALYTNRALCYLKLERFAESKQDCDAALKLEPTNKKAFYRRAMANKGLKDYLACSSDLQEVLHQDPNVQEAEKELEEVTVLLRHSLANANASPAKPRKNVPITEVDGEEETSSASNSRVGINLSPSNAFEFGQALSAARCSGDAQACAELLASTSPQTLPQYLSTQLDGQTIVFLMNAMDSHLLKKDPGLVYHHLCHLHTADRFKVTLMLLEKDDRRTMTQLFDHLSATESAEFTKNDVQNLANKYI
ncbi:sperm-associated antigen 1-like [Eucyclogobius newberryi]|uniref:sperm-associated antigen 1-like n=1 Tax=Eucyclogobius newberryi TaxID=166745 RepID=UPI003B5A0B1D